MVEAFFFFEFGKIPFNGENDFPVIMTVYSEHKRSGYDFPRQYTKIVLRGTKVRVSSLMLHF